MENKNYSVSKYLTAVKRLITDKIPTIWVRGTLTQVTTRGNICYLNIAEFKEGATRPDAVLNLVAYTGEFSRINQKLSEVDVKLEADLNVCFLVEADFYVPMGKFQAKIKDIDPSYTIGELGLAKDKILKLLQKEGLLHKNKSLEFPVVPLKIGMISAENSAAANDFRDSLSNSGFGFELIPFWSRMQGKDTEKTVALGLEYFAENPVDVICIIRGGGSKSDLAWFDSELICRSIANCKTPVLTGIGHEIDESLADLLSYQKFITPTACAMFLVDRIAEQWNHLQELNLNIVSRLKNRLNLEEHRLFNTAENILKAYPKRIKQEKIKLNTLENGLIKGPVKILAINQARFMQKVSQLQSIVRPKFSFEAQKLNQNSKQLSYAAKQRVNQEKETLNLKSRLLNNSSPEKALKRGYSIVRDTKGKVVNKKTSLKSGDELSVQLNDGVVKTTVD